jgi:wyosine [tRNA(Phe)-imidazoG37] synthetase (radical SAM superfamily)
MVNIPSTTFLQLMVLKKLKTADSKLEFIGNTLPRTHPIFTFANLRTAFTVKNLKDAPKGTDLLLEELIDHFIAEADRNAGIRAEKCSIIIRSAILEKPIQIPYRAIIQNSAQVVMQQFDDVEQSGKRLGRPSLYSQPLHIEVSLPTLFFDFYSKKFRL